MSGLIQDIHYALRQLRKNSGFALAVIATLALGIGVNTAVFSLLDGFLLRPLPYPETDRLGALLVHSDGTAPTGQSWNREEDRHDGTTWNWVRDNVPQVRVASYGWRLGGVNLSTNLGAAGDARYVQNMRVSARYFYVLGIPLFLGREFTEEEDRQGGPAAVIIRYELWRSAFNSDREIIGKAIQLKGAPYTVVGVLAQQAELPRAADVYTPLQPAPSGECGGQNCRILMRLLPGATWQQVDVQLSHLRNRYFDAAENLYKGHMWFHASPMPKDVGRETRGPLLVLMLAVTFILLIACANLSGLMLVRIAGRTPEISTRLALGGTHWTILRQLWLENLLLAVIGTVAGLGLALPVLKFLSGFLPEEYLPLGGLVIDARVLEFAFVACLLASLLFGALPALQTRHVDIRPAMASHSVARSRGRLRRVLTSANVALTIVLLAGAGVLIRSLVYLEKLPAGFDATNVITAKASLDELRYHDANAFRNLLDHSISAMKQIPGVEDAAVGLSVPYELGLNYSMTALDGKLAGQGGVSSMAYVTPEYFHTLRIPVLAGRPFPQNDGPQSEFVSVVNQAFARKFFDEFNPIGRHIRLDGNNYTIVGVVGNVAKQPGVSPNAPLEYEPMYYIPATKLAQSTMNIAHVWFQPSWIVRTRKSVGGITGEMQSALRQIDPNLPFSGFYSMNDILNENLKLQRAEVVLLGTLAALALLLSALGIYSLVSNLVAQTTREIGIRLALGAQVKQVMAETGKSGVMATAVGALLGIVLALFAVRVLQSQVYGVRVYDPTTFVAVPLLLGLVAVSASLVPTLRIARIDPAKTLRVD